MHLVVIIDFSSDVLFAESTPFLPSVVMFNVLFAESTSTSDQNNLPESAFPSYPRVPRIRFRSALVHMSTLVYSHFHQADTSHIFPQGASCREPPSNIKSRPSHPRDCRSHINASAIASVVYVPRVVHTVCGPSINSLYTRHFLFNPFPLRSL